MAWSANTRLRAAALLLAAAVVISLSLICGSSFATPTQVLHALTGSGDPLTRAVVLDLRLPRAGGLEVLSSVRKGDTELPVVIITAYGDVQSAVAAMKQGAAERVRVGWAM